MTFSLDDLNLEDVPEGAFNKENFLQLYVSNPEGLFKGLYRYLTSLDQELESANQETENLKVNIADHRRAIGELIAERDAAVTGASTTGTSSKKSTKIPNGQVLSDGVDPKYESWEIDIENKWEANADYYPTALACMAYVKSMCKGEAANLFTASFSPRLAT